MKTLETTPIDIEALRQHAESRLRERKPVRQAASELEPGRLLHELEVHQIELEMQNEELRVARLEIEASLVRYTEIFDFAPVGYVTIASDGAILEVNHTAARWLGQSRVSLLGRRFGTLVNPRHLPPFNDLCRQALTSETRQTAELELVRAETESFDVYLMVTLLLARVEPLTLIAFEDITERKRREQTLAATTRALQAADRQKNEFLSALSHELRNPLTPIQNNLYLLEEAEAGGESAKRALGVVQRQVRLLSHLLDGLLDVTRISRGKMELDSKFVDLRSLAERSVGDQRSGFERKGVKLVADLGEGPAGVHGDPARLTQALSNVLRNALEFTPPGGTVSVRWAAVGDCLTLSVIDTGVGIEPEVVPILFEPFSQAAQPLARSRGGLGLGLATVKGILELHGGSVSLRSEGSGRGTEVTLLLPRSDAPAGMETGAAPRMLRKRRVLVIEDNVDALDSMREVLRLGGHTVEIALDGARGLELARTFHPEIVFCDIGLPGMNGYAVARAFRAAPELRSVFLVASSGYSQPRDIQRALAAGFDRHAAKPVTLELLEQLLSEAPWHPRASVLE